MTQKSILITGSSSGIGLKAAIELKKRGYRVFACARKEADLARLNQQGFEAIPLDVNNTASIQSAVATLLSRTNGTLDALFNNAGYLQAGAILDLSRDLMREQFETNVFGPMELIKHVLPVMQKQGHGRIIQNSSILGIITLPFYGAYNASKFALEGFSDTLRQELRGTGIHVSILCPGPIQSKLRDNAYQQYQKTLKTSPQVYEKAYDQLEKSYFQPKEQDKRIMQPPEAVVKKLIHALESKRPRAHYYVGWPAHLFAVFRRLLPDCALDWMLAKISYQDK